MCTLFRSSSSLFFNDPPTPDIYTLSLHDALPIWRVRHEVGGEDQIPRRPRFLQRRGVAGHEPRQVERPHAGAARAADEAGDRKSTRLNSSHRCISYAVFCLKKKKQNNTTKKTIKN